MGKGQTIQWFGEEKYKVWIDKGMKKKIKNKIIAN